jgi:hypothetical protein
MVQVETVPVRQRSRPVSRIGLFLERLVYFVFGVIEVFIAVRFVLELLGANAASGFVRFVYAVSDIFMMPFNAIFHAQRVSGFYFDVSALVAILVYALVAWGLVALIRVVSPDA